MELNLEKNNGEAIKNISRIAPTTRYQGSKRRILPWLHQNFKKLEFETVLDVFGGTASVSYLLKLMGKQVTFNDILLSNFQTGIAFIQNNSVSLDSEDVGFILHENGYEYPTFIQDTFNGIYYFNKENRWLDVAAYNIEQLSEKYSGDTLKIKKALAYHILFQACLRKRPFNLFHRKNLNLRTARVERSFSNKKTWDRHFKTHFIEFHKEISKKIFSNDLKNKAICKDAMQIKNSDFDLVYLDPPYTRPGENTPKDYFSMYHFLEGIVDYDNWPQRIDWDTNNLRLIKKKSKWENNSFEKNFETLIKNFMDSKIVVSYGDPGTPSIKKIKEIMGQYKSDVKVRKIRYTYKLNRKNGTNLYETLIIGT